MTLLAIDIGNTGIKLGLFKGLEMQRSFRLASITQRTADEYAVLFKGLFDPAEVDEVIIASVVPPIGSAIHDTVRELWDREPLFVNPVVLDLMPLEVDYPGEVGVDRVVNCYAAKKLYGAPLVVIDFGTATTFDAVSTDGAYLGGAIAAGVEIAAEALYEKTALLPRVRLKKPLTDIGRNTRAAIQIGLYEGLLGQVEFIVKRFRAALGESTRVVATGGLAEEMARECPLIEEAAVGLSLTGLAMIFQDKIKSV